MYKFPASLRSDFSHCRFASDQVPLCFGIDADFIGILTLTELTSLCTTRAQKGFMVPTKSMRIGSPFTAPRIVPVPRRVKSGLPVARATWATSDVGCDNLTP